jgi:predicted RNA-binding protein YlxR (DUF448 family)
MACRQRAWKSELIRLAVGPAGVMWDESGQMGGRGGYLHRRRQCMERFAQLRVEKFTSLRRGIDRAERGALIKKVIERLATQAPLE